MRWSGVTEAVDWRDVLGTQCNRGANILLPCTTRFNADYVAVDPKQNDVGTDHSQTGVFANVRPQLIELGTLADVLDLIDDFSNE